MNAGSMAPELLRARGLRFPYCCNAHLNAVSTYSNTYVEHAGCTLTLMRRTHRVGTSRDTMLIEVRFVCRTDFMCG